MFYQPFTAKISCIFWFNTKEKYQSLMHPGKHYLSSLLCSQWLKWQIKVPKTCLIRSNRSILDHADRTDGGKGKGAKFWGKFWRFRPIWRPARGRSQLQLGLKPYYTIAKGYLKARTVANGRERSYFLSKVRKFAPKRALFALWWVGKFPLQVIKYLEMKKISNFPYQKL